MKPYPKGIFYLLSAPGGDFLASLQTIETDGFMDKPWIDGARGRTGWSSICPSNSTPNWTQIDSALAICEAHGKKLTLSISAGNSVPSWVYTTQPLVTKFTALDATTMPLPWEENYQRKWEAFIQAFGQRYDSNPLLASVFFTGMQNDVEMHVTTTPEDDIAYNAAAVAAGYANKSVAWIAATKTIMQMWINSFPNTATILTTAPSPWDDTIQGGIDENTIENYARATWGDKFGTSISFLHATVAHNNDPQRVTFPKGAQPIFASSDHTRFYSDPQPPVFPSDPIPMFDLFENAYDKGEQYLEVYDFDARHPVNEPTFITERLKLISNVPTKGLGNKGRISLAPREGDTLEYPEGVWGQYGAGNDLPQEVASNIGLVGAGVSEDWNVIDRGPLANPRYDWSTLDPKIQQAIDVGLKVNLIITNSSDNTPQWLIDQEKLANPSEVIDLIDPASNHNTFCKPISTIVYWNTAFHQARLDLVAAAGAHYASNTEIVAVTAQFANHNSNDWNIQDNVNQDPDFLVCPMCPQLPPRLCGNIELDQPLQWLMAGWTEPKMVQVGKELMTAYANAFPRQNIKLPIGGLEDRLASEGRVGGGDYSAMARDIEEFIYGNGVDIEPQPYAGRFWFQRNIVDANWGDGFDHYDPASPDYAIPGTGAQNYIKYMIYKHAQATGPTPRHAGLQMVAAATGMADDCRLGGKSGGPCGYPVCPDLCVMNASLNTAFSYNVAYTEVFPQDSANIEFDALYYNMTLLMDGTPRRPPPQYSRFVDSSVTTSGDGKSWATAWKGVTNITGLQPGYTVYFSGGSSSQTYPVTNWTPAGGISGKQIRYKASPEAGKNGTVIFDVGNTGNFLNGSFSNVIIDGMVNNSRHMSVQNASFIWKTGSGISSHCVIRGIDCPSMKTAMYFLDATMQSIEIDNCAFHKIYDAGALNDAVIQYLSGTTEYEHRIHNCHFYIPVKSGSSETGDDCIKWGSHMEVDGNTFEIVYGTYPGTQHSDVFQIKESFYKIHDNKFIGVGESLVYHDQYLSPISASDLYFYNNLCINTTNVQSTVVRGLDLQPEAGGVGTTFTRFIVANNTWVDWDAGVFLTRFDNASSYTDCFNVNNAKLNCVIGDDIDTGVTNAHNVSAPGSSFVSYTLHNVNNDLHLVSGASTLINQAQSMSTYFKDDYDGKQRTSTWDIGAYEF